MHFPLPFHQYYVLRGALVSLSLLSKSCLVRTRLNVINTFHFRDHSMQFFYFILFVCVLHTLFWKNKHWKQTAVILKNAAWKYRLMKVTSYGKMNFHDGNDGFKLLLRLMCGEIICMCWYRVFRCKYCTLLHSTIWTYIGSWFSRVWFCDRSLDCSTINHNHRLSAKMHYIRDRSFQVNQFSH